MRRKITIIGAGTVGASADSLKAVIRGLDK